MKPITCSSDEFHPQCSIIRSSCPEPQIRTLLIAAKHIDDLEFFFPFPSSAETRPPSSGVIDSFEVHEPEYPCDCEAEFKVR